MSSDEEDAPKPKLAHKPPKEDKKMSLLNPSEVFRTYSTIWGNNTIGTGHARSRLSSPQAWSAGVNDQNQWMIIHLGVPIQIAGVSVQGRKSSAQAVTRFKVSVSNDGKTWTDVGDEKGFKSATSNDEVPQNLFFPFPVSCCFVRFCPTEWCQHISMRAGLLVNSVDQATWHVVHHWGKYHYETFNSEEAARTYYAKLGDGMSRGLWRNANLMDAWAYDDGWANNIRNHFKEVIGAMEPNTRSHPLADKTMLILKAEDGSCLSFRSSDSCLRTSYTNPDDFMPVKFCAVQGRPGVYILQNLYEGNDGQAYINSWIAVDTSEDERGYFYVRTNTKSQATPLEFVELPEQKGAYKIINRTSGVPKLGVEFIDDWLYTQDNHWLSIGASADQATTFLLKPCVGWMYDFAGTKFAIHEDMSLSIQNVPVELSSTDNGCLRLAKVSRSNNQKETLQGCVEAHHACYKKLTAEVAQLQLQITKLENDLDTKLDLSQEAEETLDNEARALRRQKRKVRKELQRMDAMKTISISYNEVTTGVSVTLAPGQSVQPSFLSRPVVFFRAATVTEQPVSETSIKTEYASL